MFKKGEIETAILYLYFWGMTILYIKWRTVANLNNDLLMTACIYGIGATYLLYIYINLILKKYE